MVDRPSFPGKFTLLSDLIAGLNLPATNGFLKDPCFDEEEVISAAAAILQSPDFQEASPKVFAQLQAAYREAVAHRDDYLRFAFPQQIQRLRGFLDNIPENARKKSGEIGEEIKATREAVQAMKTSGFVAWFTSIFRPKQYEQDVRAKDEKEKKLEKLSEDSGVLSQQLATRQRVRDALDSTKQRLKALAKEPRLDRTRLPRQRILVLSGMEGGNGSSGSKNRAANEDGEDGDLCEEPEQFPGLDQRRRSVEQLKMALQEATRTGHLFLLRVREDHVFQAKRKPWERLIQKLGYTGSYEWVTAQESVLKKPAGAPLVVPSKLAALAHRGKISRLIFIIEVSSPRVLLRHIQEEEVRA